MDANETITKSSGNTANQGYTYVYDMRSQLTDANTTNIGSGTWAADYAYHKSGNMSFRTVQSVSETFDYSGDQMTDANDNSLSYDENGNLTAGVDVDSVHRWGGEGEVKNSRVVIFFGGGILVVGVILLDIEGGGEGRLAGGAICCGFSRCKMVCGGLGYRSLGAGVGCGLKKKSAWCRYCGSFRWGYLKVLKDVLL